MPDKLDEFDAPVFDEEIKLLGKEGKDIKDFQSSIILEPQPFPTLIVAYAVHKNPSNNAVKSIQGKQGIPIGGYSYHVVEDCFDVRCVDTLPLGEIGVSLKMTLPGCSQWHVFVPLPENIIKRYLANKQKNDLRNFREKYPANDFNIEYFQMISHG